MCGMTPYSLVCVYRHHQRNTLTPTSLISQKMLAVGSSKKLVPKYQTTRRHYTNATIQIFSVINIWNLLIHCMCSLDEIHNVSRHPNFLNTLIQKVVTSSWIMTLLTPTRISDISTRLVAFQTWLMATLNRIMAILAYVSRGFAHCL